MHHPVLDAAGETVTTAITNLDIHDLSRSARTYDATDTFIVHPVEAQRVLAQRICDHWRDGSSGRRIPDRKEALSRTRIVTSLEEAVMQLGGPDVVSVWVTAARTVVPSTSFPDAQKLLTQEGGPVLIVFGTGWGLSRQVLEAANVCLEPIHGRVGSGYNHLSVRAAAAIILDRLLGVQ